MKHILFILLLAISLKSFGQQKEFVITNFGAIADGITNNKKAIQQAIDEASKTGNGKVIVPKGKFVTGVLEMKDNVELFVAEGGHLLGSSDRNEYGPSFHASALLIAHNKKNIALTGKGLIDGNCDELIKDIYVKLRAGQLQDKEWKDFNPWFQRRPSENNRPRIIEFDNCNGVIVKNIHIQNSTSWVQCYKECSNIVVDSIHVVSNTFWNNDGIDLVDCKNAKVTNSFFNVADDGVCLKSGNRKSFCDNIYVANCKIRSSASAVKLGTASWGGFKHITIMDIEVYDTYRSAIAIETVDGGIIDGVLVNNIVGRNTGNAIFVKLGHRNTDSVYGSLKNIHISNIKVQVPKGKPDKGYSMEGPALKYPKDYKKDTTKYTSVSPWNNSGIDSTAVPYPHNTFPSSISGLPNHVVENVTLENIEIVYEGEANKSVNYFPIDSLQNITEATKDYPEFSMFGELPVWGFYVRHVKGLTFKNVTVHMKGKDFRNPFLLNDVKGLNLINVQAKGITAKPDFVLKNVEQKK
jgi:polygalacturonase